MSETGDLPCLYCNADPAPPDGRCCPPAGVIADLAEQVDALQGAINDAAEALIGEGYEFNDGAVADALIPYADDRFTGDLVDISRGDRAKPPAPTK